ncbi:MAG: M14 family metallopeptidase [Leeuwenhoekiella sp.]
MKQLFIICSILACLSAIAQIPTPTEFLGYELGSQFTRHASVVDYFEKIDDTSESMIFQEYGKTNEGRPLTYAVVSTPENLSDLEEIRKNHLQNAGLLSGTASSNLAVVWLSYNVHGNEASSTEAAMKTLHTLLTEKQDWLKNTVVIIDPCVNPDGRDRYANWYNQVKSTPYDTGQDAAEHHEPWPGGRPNHYLFDLNRDWAWATQVETQARLKVYNQWMPHIHVDFHEQGINSPYYFAPGAEPYHEQITDFQRNFQTEIGKNHAKYFDKNGWLYFTKEVFDLLYPSYGDTYPMYNGAIGMTYEQAGHGRAGLGIETDEGQVLTLKDRVAHHTTAGLSTVEMAHNNAARLTEAFQNYFDNSASGSTGFTVSGNVDRVKKLAELLDRHNIKYSLDIAEKSSGKMANLKIARNQPKGKLIQILFEKEAALSTPLTYDITAWSLPYAYGLEVTSGKLTSGTATENLPVLENKVDKSAVAYLLPWQSMEDARFLSQLLMENVKVRFSEKAFNNNDTYFEPGSLIITRGDNASVENFDKIVVETANELERKLTVSTSGFSASGPDFGSGNIKLIDKPKIGLLRGDAVSSLNFGAIWYYFEQELKFPVTVLGTDYFSRINLDAYDILIMPSGRYSGLLSESTLDKLKSWLRSGGKLIAIDGAIAPFASSEDFKITKNKTDEVPDKKADSLSERLIPYAERESSGVDDLMTGSILETQVDATHPLAFGYPQNYATLKLGTDSYAFLKEGYNVAYIKDAPKRISGYAGKNALQSLENSLVFGVEPYGRGSLIYFVDDPLFRGFWENGKLFFANALFLVNNGSYDE